MLKTLKKAEIALAAAIAVMSVLCIGLVVHDSVIARENYTYFEEVSSSKAAGIYLININTADKEELIDLPGVGEVIATRIIEYREKNGAYTSAEDLLNIQGIGEKTLEDILDAITY